MASRTPVEAFPDAVDTPGHDASFEDNVQC